MLKIVRLTLTEEMLARLKACSGQELQSLKYMSLGNSKAFANLGLNLSQGNWELSNYLIVADINGRDDYAQLAFTPLPNDTPPPSLEATDYTKESIGQVITEVKLVTDTITFQIEANTWQVIIDVAVVFVMGNSVLVCQKDIWFSEEIVLIANPDWEKQLIPPNQGWDFEPEARAVFQRKITELS